MPHGCCCPPVIRLAGHVAEGTASTRSAGIGGSWQTSSLVIRRLFCADKPSKERGRHVRSTCAEPMAQNLLLLLLVQSYTTFSTCSRVSLPSWRGHEEASLIS